MHSNASADADRVDLPARPSTWREMRSSEDWWAVWIGGLILAALFGVVCASRPADFHDRVQAIAEADTKKDKADLTKSLQKTLSAPIGKWFAKPLKWEANPLESLYVSGKHNVLPGLIGAFVLCLAVFSIAVGAMGQAAARFASAFVHVFPLAALAYLLAEQSVVNYFGLEYALWALLLGLFISNTIGTPDYARPAVRTELYIKTGLVLLGAEVLLHRLVALGTAGIFVSWIVTPIVLIGTYAFGQRVLKMQSRSLNMVISADMSVCGVSAAMATAAACKAKKEELSLAIGISLAFTVAMMVLQPAFIKWVGMSDILGGAWIGGTIDSTGAVAAAGAALGDRALEVATTVKMIQNILIGVTAFGVAVYWVTCVETRRVGSAHHDDVDDSALVGTAHPTSTPNAWEIWYRFPKFVIGFLAASVVFTLLSTSLPGGGLLVGAVTDVTKLLRGWFFCLAFVSIGLETNFRELAGYLRDGKALMLYVCGQCLNLVLTLTMAYLMFEVLLKEQIEKFAS